jgi:uncharacterized protein
MRVILIMLLAVVNVGAAWAGRLEDASAARDRGDYATAFKIYRPLAAQGNAVAQHNLGDMHARGQGVKQDYAEAVKWYRLAAAQGHAVAQNNLGAQYQNGQSVARDNEEARKWYRLAAAQGNARAQYNLGALHHEAWDYAEALKWYRLAAAQGEADAQYNLGVMYARGQGVAQDDVRAHMWFNLGAVSGDAQSAESRDVAARGMTPQQIAEARKLARECEARKFQDCDSADALPPKNATSGKSEVKGAVILDHPCGKHAVKMMGLIHAGKIKEFLKLGGKDMQEQWKAMSAKDKTMWLGAMKMTSQTEKQYSADIKAYGVLVIDGPSATLTLKKTTKEESGGGGWEETTEQSFKIDARQCLGG